MSKRYRTIDAAPGHGVDIELEVKRSRFLARLRRVEDEPAARAVIEERRATHINARHHCSAFVIGPDARTTRSSDDGEPAGTAGVPMLQVLRTHEVTETVAVVSRYFGGIKLGAGGLVRAYTEAVTQAVAVCGTREVVLSRLLRIDVDYAEAGSLEASLRGLRLLSGAKVAVEDVDWQDRARITVSVAVDAEDEFRVALAALSSGCLEAADAGQRWRG